MKRLTKIIVLTLVAGLLLTACSNKGVHMSKHRKSRKCNCPSFVENPYGNPDHVNEICEGQWSSSSYTVI